MVLDCYRIHDKLFQGPLPPLGTAIADAGFDVLVLCAWENQDASEYQNVEVIQAPGEDIVDWPIEPTELKAWQEASQVVYQRLREGKRVLVTCMGGYNRSGMVSAMTLNLITGWNGEAVVEHVKMRRRGALHNRSFARWLTENLKESST